MYIWLRPHILENHQKWPKKGKWKNKKTPFFRNCLYVNSQTPSVSEPEKWISIFFFVTRLSTYQTPMLFKFQGLSSCFGSPHGL